MTIPNLAGVITRADIETKGTGSYAASYVNWAKVAHLLHEHAPGWQFHLHQDEATKGYVYTAPDGTAYVVGYFTAPDRDKTADFPFPCMDMRNNPIPADKVSARMLTDTHRRALCAAAAYTFGLAYELWAKEEVENPHREDAPAPKAAPAAAKTVKSSPTPAQAKPTAPKAETSPAPDAPKPLPAAERDEIIEVLKHLKTSDAQSFDSFCSQYRKHFKLDEKEAITKHLQEVEHGAVAQQILATRTQP